MYYVYTWSRPGNIPFYVGLGRTKTRWDPVTAKTRNKHCRHVVQKIGTDNVNVSIISDLSKEDACRLEQTLIYYYGRQDLGSGPLTNMTDGGDGTHNASLETRLRISNTLKTNGYSLGDKNPAKRPEVRKKLKAAWKDSTYRTARVNEKIGRKIHSEEHKETLRLKLLDPANPMREQHKILNSDPTIKEKRLAALLSQEVQDKIKLKLNDPEVKAKRVAKLRETQSSPEWKAKNGKRSEETKAKMAEAAKARWAKRKGLI